MGAPPSPDLLTPATTPEYDPSITETPDSTDPSSFNPKVYLATFFVMNKVSQINQKMIESYVAQVQKEAEVQSENRKEDDLKQDILKAVRKLQDSPEKRRLMNVFLPDHFPHISTDSVESMR